ncbi:hypothetical protein LI313_02305 [Proteus mirabilis]|uniref:hypothetical protein n=1 Tax=Proteus mirabilis TaxID=584 RepID=UPI001D09667E|nr:hypothetical protein [Proteus mirabilis]MCB6147312.1 hypothetical protein [Proteus mirabilis]
MSEFKYQSDSYDRQSQRFVIPLYIKDEIGDYHFSSTGTFIIYNKSHYIVFAAHALERSDDINNIAMLGIDGLFIDLIDISLGYRIFEDDDLVIVDCFNNIVDGKNYFLLKDKPSFIGFDKKHFAWTGFPQSWCKVKIIHRTKKPESIIKEIFVNNEDGNFLKNARYFTILSKVKLFNKKEITGNYSIKNVDLKYKGPVNKGPNPQGMSGGAMYFFSKGQVLKDNINSTFLFAGIGLSFQKDGTITGISRDRVIELLKQFNKESPLVFEISLPK